MFLVGCSREALKQKGAGVRTPRSARGREFSGHVPGGVALGRGGCGREFRRSNRLSSPGLPAVLDADKDDLAGSAHPAG